MELLSAGTNLTKEGRESAIKKMSPRLQAAFAEMSPEILDMTEIELELHFNRTPNDFLLRKRLWELVPITSYLTIDMWVGDIVRKPYFYQYIAKQPYRLAWIFTPIQPHTARYEELFDVLFKKIKKKVIETTIDDKNFLNMIRLLENIANRAYGAVPRNIQLKAAHVHTNIPTDLPSSPVNAEDLEKRLQELEAQKLNLAKTVSPDEPS